MRYLFRMDRSDDTDRVPIPFYNYRRLSQEELQDCLKIYIQKRQSDILSSLPHRSSRTSSQPPSGVQWPDFSRFGLGNQDFWKVEVAFARLCLAQTKADQQRARTAVKKLAQKGPLALRKALGQAVRQIPQAKRRFSRRDVLLKLKGTHSAWEFVRTFLRRESCLTPEELKNRPDVDCAAQDLASEYPYLHMSAEHIAEGLRNQRPADKDTARCYGLSQASIRPLFGKYFPRR
jgi:hypothetical protein